MSAAPREQRSQAFGLAQGGMSLGQGTVMILAGAAADHYSPAWVIAVSGTIGAAVALAIAVSWAGNRMQSTDGRLRRLGLSPSGCRAFACCSCRGWVGWWAGGVGFSPSGCRAWCAAPVVDGLVGWVRGLAPVGVAHSVLLPFGGWVDSLRNHLNAPAGDAVRPRALAAQGAPCRVPHPLWASRLPIVARNCAEGVLCTYCRE